MPVDAQTHPSKASPPWPRNPVLAACRACQHVWPALWLPCDVKLLSKATPKCCPACGSQDKENIVVAGRSNGDLGRYADWLEIELARARAHALGEAT